MVCDVKRRVSVLRCSMRTGLRCAMTSARSLFVERLPRVSRLLRVSCHRASGGRGWQTLGGWEPSARNGQNEHSSLRFDFGVCVMCVGRLAGASVVDAARA